MKQLIVYATLAAFAGTLNEVLARDEAAWLPGKLEIRGGNVVTVLKAVPHSSPQSPGSILEFHLLQGDAPTVQAELDELQAENPYWKAVAVGIDDHLEAVVLKAQVEEAKADPPAPAAKNAAKKAAKKATKKVVAAKKAEEVGPAFDLVVLVARLQP